MSYQCCLLNTFCINGCLFFQELNLGQIKAKLTRSSRLEEMKQALARINQSKAKLTNIQEKLSHSSNQTLDQLETVELEIPYSRYV